MAGEAAAGTTTDTRECPFCKEEIKAEAIKCKHCGSRLAPEEPSHGGACPYCKEDVKPDAIKCKHCGSFIGPGSSDAAASTGCSDCSEPASMMQPQFPSARVVSRSQFYPPWGGAYPPPWGGGGGDIWGGGWGETLPSCGWEQVPCGSSPPGVPPPMCWIYCCRWPNGHHNCRIV
jgi:hypothetical protein